MAIKDWREVVTTDFPQEPPITEETKRLNGEYAKRRRADVRIATGRIKTDAEYEARRNRILYGY